MGIFDSLKVASPVDPVEVPPFVPSDVSALSDRELLEKVLVKLETFEHMARAFSAQAQAHPLLKSLAPKL